ASILLSARTTESSYQITQVQAENNQLQAEAQQLHYQAAALHTPEQVAAEARAEGMNYPAAAGYLQLPSEGFDLQAPIGTATDQNSPWRLFSMAANSIYGLSFPQSGVA
ncbi:MAG: hypothetical protein ACREP9_09955, partial [Candidatus Dormibacteraceae bacterium]